MAVEKCCRYWCKSLSNYLIFCFKVYLDIFGKSGKKLYVNIGHNSWENWTTILDCDGQSALKEAERINSFKSDHPGITGLLLRNLEPSLVIFDLVIILYCI